MTLYTFQVFYQLADCQSGILMDTSVTAETAVQARQIIEGPGRFAVHNVGPGKVFIGENQFVFDKTEAAEFLRGTPSMIDKAMRSRELPPPVNGHPLFTRPMLLNFITKRMGVNLEEAA